MKKFKFIIITLLLYMCISIFMNSKEITNSIIFSFDIWKNSIFPSLFPLFVISNILINYGFVDIVSTILYPISKIFKVSSSSCFVIVMGLLSGFPSSSKYVSELVKQNIISKNEASKVLTFTHFSNPLFVINTIGISFLNSYKLGLLILFIHYISNFIVGFIFRNYKVDINNNTIKNNYNNSLGKVITDSISSSINTLFLILGTVSFFLIITTIINNSIPLNSFFSSIISGIFEMTQGLKYVSLLDISLKIKCVLSVMFISFGGISIHIQTFSIINESGIKYLPFFIARIIHALIAGILMFILF